MVHLCKVYKADSHGAVGKLSPFLAKALNLKEGSIIRLRFGSLSTQVNVLTEPSFTAPENRIGLSGEILAALKIPPNIHLSVKPIDREQVRLGPVIGILTFPHVINKTQLYRYVNYAERMKKTGLLYVFRPSDIHPEIQTVAGFYYDAENRTWESGEFPYPDVVMDRMYPNDWKSHFELEKVIGPNKIFNRKTLITKIDFNEVLKKTPYLNSCIPETKIFLSARDLEYFLEKYNGAFLKPVDSMRGRGIIFVNTEGKEQLCRYMDGSAVVIKKIPRADYIFEILGRVNDNMRPYIVQAAVNKMKYMGRVFSFRIMTAKDGSGCWSVPIIIAKAARPGAFLTNVSSGAEYVLMKDILGWINNQLPGKSSEVVDQLTDLSLQAAAALDKEFGPLGKLGIDAVIDVSGKVWLIEANGNPGVIYRRGQKEYPDWHRQAYTLPLSYAMYLAGFSDSGSVKTELVTLLPEAPT